MFEDEARVGRISEPYVCWSPAGVRPTVGAQMIRQYAYVFGAISPQDGQHDHRFCTTGKATDMSDFLAQVRANHPGDFILMILDGAPWHKAKHLVKPEHMALEFLPPYCPDLNPEEQVWDELREKHFANRLFASLDAVVDAAKTGLDAMASKAKDLIRLAGRGWILDSLVALNPPA